MTDYYQYFELEGITQEFTNAFEKLVKELTATTDLTFNMHGSFDKPEITFVVTAMDFERRHFIDNKVRELLNESNVKFTFCTAG